MPNPFCIENIRSGLKLVWIISASLCFHSSLTAQNFWSDWTEDGFVPTGERYIQPLRYRTASLNVQGMRSQLRNAPMEFTQAGDESNFTISLPTPDGSVQTFQIVESPVMHPYLQAKYPEIRCYSGFNPERPNERIKCDLTPHGFHAMVTGAQGGAWFIDPYSMGDLEHYTIYKKADYQKQTTEDFVCHVEEHLDPKIDQNAGGTEAGDCKLRSYRLALACTGEYGVFHGGTVPLALAAMNTSVNRVNSVYERDHAIRMVLIPNNDLLIYLNGATDPYTNNNGGTMLGQNQTNVTTVIGGANYDIGHVFSTGGGGIASLGSVCSANNKARGVTGAPQPVGDPFDIDYVVHEMGHQFAENHTFYNSCGGNKTAAAAFEPGSGSTIMAYAGICPPNVQNNSDDYFHARSLQETATFLVSGGGNACANQLPITNSAPTVEAGANYTIPGGTPFVLTASGFDSDAANVLTYCWEQMNNDGAFTQPPTATNAGGPMFRSYDPTVAPERYFPRLQNVIANTNNTWEVLSTVNRTLNFRVTVRDNASPAGCTGEDNMVVTVHGAGGPFLVTAPNTNVTWNVGENQTVTWNVAGTNAAPINTAQVRISLSTDGGLTFPIVLADGVPNNGSAIVTVPNAVSNTCRVKVEGRGNIFYDMSNVNFRIQLPPVPTFVLSSTLPQTNVCPGQAFIINVEASGVLGFNTPVNLSISGLPSGVTADYSVNPVTPTGSSTISLSGFTAAQVGALNLTITGVGGSITQTSVQNVQVLSGAPASTNTRTPANFSTGIGTATSLIWDASNLASVYQIQLATNVAFAAGDIVRDQNAPGTSLAINGLAPTTVYFWRVRAINDCGISAWSPVSAFQTSACATFTNNTPVLIPDLAGAATSNLVLTGGTISDVNVQLDITHSWVGDIDAKLTSPGGTTVTLFDRPGVPASQYGCESDNMMVTLDDQATNTSAQLEGACNATAPAISGTYKPVTALSGFTGANAAGSWTLVVTDYENNDGGNIASWNIQVCYSTTSSNLAVTNQALQVGQGQSGVIGTSLLSANSAGASPGTLRYMVLSNTTNGTLSLSGTPLGLGGTFTQADINSGLLSYQHGSNSATTDQFIFQVTEANGSGWITSRTFQIEILLNTLAASAVVTQQLLCYNQNNGSITVNASGGNGSVSYSLNGGAYQGSNVFNGLAAGTYAVTVRDVAGFTVTTNQVTMNNPAELTLNVAVNGDEITMNAAGGTGTLQYSINGGALQQTNVFSGLANGAYSCLVTDANGCTQSSQAIVAVNSLVTGASVLGQISCHGLSDGSITVAVGGGQSPYTFTLVPNGTVQVGNPTFAGLGAGTYSVSVQDAQGFSATTNQIILVAPDQLVATATASQNTITVTASGGAGNLTYALSGGSLQSSNIFTNLQNGSYTILIQDGNGCQTSASATINVPPLGVSAQTSGAILCFGQSTGTVIANASGGIPPYNFQLNGGTTQISNTFSGLPAGNYTVGVIDATGSSSIATVNVPEPNQLVASSAVSFNTVTVTVSGGTTPYTYTLSGNTQTSPVFTGLANGAYSILVTDANGCTTQVGATVNVPAIQAANAYSGTILCFGNQTLTLTVSVTGGIPPYTYSLNGGTAQTSNQFTGLGAGAHSVVVTDSQGRTFTANSNATGPTALNAAVNVNIDLATATATGGTSPYQYSLNSGPLQSNPTFGPLAPGNYSGIVVTDANGCTSTTLSFTITSGTEDLLEVFGLSVSPNPGSGYFVLQVEQGAQENLAITVTDMSGRRTILHHEMVQGATRLPLDLSAHATGAYLLQVRGKHEQASAVLLIQR